MHCRWHTPACLHCLCEQYNTIFHIIMNHEMCSSFLNRVLVAFHVRAGWFGSGFKSCFCSETKTCEDVSAQCKLNDEKTKPTFTPDQLWHESSMKNQPLIIWFTIIHQQLKQNTWGIHFNMIHNNDKILQIFRSLHSLF